MAEISICGPSYSSQSPNADDQMCLNRYPEIIESGQGVSRIVLYPTPGIKTFCTLSDGPVRGQCKSELRSFAVGGSIFSEILSDGTKADYSPIANDGLPVSMAVGETQILIASAGLCYVFDLNANTLNQIPVGTLNNVSKVAYCMGFYIALFNNSHTFQASAVLDATSWPPLSVSTTNVFSDNLLAVLVDHLEVWLFGLTKSVVYYNSGNFPFPFDVQAGAVIEQGIVAANSPVRLDNSVFWLGGDERGVGIAWRAQGYTPARISNHAVEFAWQGYSRIDDAIGYAYQDQGHSFWVLYFPTANKTWVYDVATGMWHERGYWNKINGIFTAHRSQNHVYAFGKHLVGDWASAKIYEMAIDIYDDDGNPLRWIRRAPHISKEQQWQFHSQLQIYLEPGVGPQPPLLGPSDSPPFYILKDSSGGLWKLTVSDSGILSTTSVSSGISGTYYLNDISDGSSWQIGVTTGGLLTTTSVAAANYANQWPIATSPGFLQGSIQISGGLLQTTPAYNAARDPIIEIRWSDDGGATWSNVHEIGIGQAGNFRKRVMIRRLGRTRDRIYEIAGSDPVPYRIVGAYLN